MRWIWFLLVALVPSHAAGQSARIDEVVVLERGVYRAETAGPSQHHGTAGRLHTVQRIKLLADTTSIPARRFTRFGLRYLVKGAPHGTLVELRMVTRFPRDGVVEPPGDRRHFEHEYRLPVRIGISGYREYYLDESWEVAADSDEVGQVFQFEAGHLFRFEAGRCSDAKSATWERPEGRRLKVIVPS